MLFGLQKQNSETRNNYLNNDYITNDQNNNFLVNDETEQVPNKNQLKPLEEQILSQNYTQSSTTNANDKLTMIKDIEDKIKKIPDYLTKRNQSFQQMLHQALSTITKASLSLNKNDNKNNIDALRHIAILIYKIIFIQNYEILWKTYLKSGMGQLIIQSSQNRFIYPTNIKIWPQEIKIMIKSTRSMNETNENEICFDFVNENLHQLDTQLKQYESELKIQTTNFQGGYTLTIQQMIETYIEKNLQSFRMEIEHQIQLVHYDYHIRALKLEYFQQNTNEYQIQSMKEICRSKFDQETTEQEWNFLKQQITYYNLPSQSFDSSPIAHSLLNDFSIQDEEIRQDLYQKCKTIAEECRANLFAMYMEEAENQREEYKKKDEANMKKLFSLKHSLNDKEKLSPIMIQLINERCNKISERIKCIYQFKAQSLFSK